MPTEFLTSATSTKVRTSHFSSSRRLACSRNLLRGHRTRSGGVYGAISGPDRGQDGGESRAWTLCVVRRRVVDRQRQQQRRGGAILSLSDIGDVAEDRGGTAAVEWEGDRLTGLLGVLSTREEEVYFYVLRD